jgi:DNA-binding response OmpR family regulator
MAKILIVEDNIELCASIVQWLEQDHHVIEGVNSGSVGLEMLLSFQFDLIILDWELPEISGVELCRRYRAEGGNSPILMLTAKSQLDEKREGFDAGADDYLTKPFHLMELSLRIRALLRRSGPELTTLLKTRDIELEPDCFRARKAGKEIKLLPKEFAVLEFLMRNPDRVYSLESLLKRLWLSDSDASPEAVQACIRRLRRKIDTEGQESLILNVHGVGYKLNVT